MVTKIIPEDDAFTASEKYAVRRCCKVPRSFRIHEVYQVITSLHHMLSIIALFVDLYGQVLFLY